MLRKILKGISHRSVIITFLIALQVVWVGTLFLRLSSYSNYIATAFKLLSVVVVIYIINRDDNPAMKIVWIVVILLAPLFGGLLYLYIGDKRMMTPLRRKVMPMLEASEKYLASNEQLEEEIRQMDPNVAGQIHYLQHLSGYPAYKDSKVDYFPSGEACYPVILQALKNAKKYIFLEYFIVEEGLMWDGIVDILAEKVKEGIDVRLIYDDVGSMFVLPKNYENKLREKGIKVIVFNKYIPIVSVVFNNRDHRKILVIDGEVAFTGGINMADEYINKKKRFGYWKDNGVKITGRAVYNMTMMFLQMWNAFAKDEDDLDYDAYPREEALPVENRGLVLPYSDHPLDSEFVGESVYINMVNTAKKYVYFFTPYLIIDNEMITALTLAAKKGVDVRILTPGIPDKKLVNMVTQSYYMPLVKGGVSIYEYDPGFIHSKCAVCDDKIATVGTINLDYRSLFLHFENGVFLYDCSTVMDIKKDIVNTMKECTKITLEMCSKSLPFRIVQALLRVFSPLL